MPTATAIQEANISNVSCTMSQTLLPRSSMTPSTIFHSPSVYRTPAGCAAEFASKWYGLAGHTKLPDALAFMRLCYTIPVWCCPRQLKCLLESILGPKLKCSHLSLVPSQYFH